MQGMNSTNQCSSCLFVQNSWMYYYIYTWDIKIFSVHTGSPHGEITIPQFTQGLLTESYLLHSSHRISTGRTSSSKFHTVSPVYRNTLLQIDIFIKKKKKPWYNFQNQMLPEVKKNHKGWLQMTYENVGETEILIFLKKNFSMNGGCTVHTLLRVSKTQLSILWNPARGWIGWSVVKSTGYFSRGVGQDLSSNHSTHLVLHSRLPLQFQAVWWPPLASVGTRHTNGLRTNLQASTHHTHMEF